MKPTDIQWREQLREAILCYMADRPTRSFSVSELTSRREVRNHVDVEFDESHVNDALAVLEGFKLVTRVDRPLSGMQDYQVTAEGVTFRERQYP